MMLVEETAIPASALPVDPFKAHLRVGTGFADDAVQDAVLESFLRAAIAAVESRTGKILIEREFSWNLMDWRDAAAQPLPVAPVSEVTEVALIDADEMETILPPTDFVLAQDFDRPKLLPKGSCLPMIPHKGSVDIVFTAGFATDFDELPADIAQAVLMLATHYYENRNAIGLPDVTMPFGVSVLLERYKTIRILGGARA